MDNTTSNVPSQSSPSDQIQANQYNMDVNIMRTALILFLVVITVVVILNLLHLYAKCVLSRRMRHHRRTTHLIDIRFSADEHVNSRGEPKHGLDSSIITALPTFSYRRSSDDRVGDAETDLKECTVCLGTLEDEEIVKVLPNCKHIYHVQCIDMWLTSNSTCPVCRTGAKPLEPIGDHHHLQAPSSQMNETGFDGVVVRGALPVDSSNLSITPPRSDQIVQDIGGAPPVKEGESGLSSLRRILSRERSVRTNQQQPEQSDAVLEDLERQ